MVHAEICFAFVFSYICVKDITTLCFIIYLSRSLSLSKSLTQWKQLLSHLLRKKKKLISELPVVDIIQVSLVFKMLPSLLCACVCKKREDVTSNSSGFKFHGLSAERTCQKTQSYLLTTTENPGLYNRQVILIWGEGFVYRTQLLCGL